MLHTLLAAIVSLVMLQTQTHTHMYANKHTHMQTHKHTHRHTDPPPTPHRWGWGDGRLDDFLHVITLTVFPKELDVFSLKTRGTQLTRAATINAGLKTRGVQLVRGLTAWAYN